MEKQQNKKKPKGKLARHLVLVLVFIGIILFTLQDIILSNHIQKAETKSYTSFMQEIVAARAGQIENWFDIYKNELLRYGNSSVVRTGNAQEIASWLFSDPQAHTTIFDYVLFAGPNGTAFATNGALSHISDEKYFKAIMNENKKEYMGNPIISKMTGAPVVHLAIPARNGNGKVIGVLAGTLSLKTLQDTVAAIHTGKNSFSFIISGDGTIAAHSNAEKQMTNVFEDTTKKYVGIISTVKAMTEGKNGSETIHDEHNHPYMATYTPIASTPYSFAICVPETQIKESSVAIRNDIILISIGILTLLSFFCSLFIRKAINPLVYVRTIFKKIASGDADLTQTLQVRSTDEIGDLVQEFNTFTGKLRSIVAHIKTNKDRLTFVDKDLQTGIRINSSSITEILENIENISSQITNNASSAEQTAGAVTQIAENIDSLNRMIGAQSESVIQASAAAEQMLKNNHSITTSMGEMSTAFSELREDARSGLSKESDVNNKIEIISRQSKMLAEANIVIADIASQTNLLSMNAAIEAAHAGNTGKGFSVVADEIRKLSENSRNQSKTISDELKKILESIEDVVTASEESRHAFISVSDRIDQTNTVVQHIGSSLEESNKGSLQISNALKTLNDMTLQIKTASSEMSTGDKSILEEITRLNETAASMKNYIGAMSKSAKNINETGTQLSDLSQQMEKTIIEIGGEIDLFKV